jgi:hypothetical protein
MLKAPEEEPMYRKAFLSYLFLLGLMLTLPESSFAWGNRGHRMINLAAATALPADMPAFMRTPDAIQEISYFGPEPDRWRPFTEPELTVTSSPDHGFHLELGDLVGSYPRSRYEFIRLMAMVKTPAGVPLAPSRVGLLPWQAIEVFDRLKSAFREYRLLTGEFPGVPFTDIQPMTHSDLPYVEHSILFYAGWLGHYIGDGSQPLHTTVNTNGWVKADNPKGYTTKKGIHTALEQTTDNAIQADLLQPSDIQKYMTTPKKLADPFLDTISYLRESYEYVEPVYEFEKEGALEGNGTQGNGTPEFRRFVAQRMAFGGSMLRDMIYTAWLDSKDLGAPSYPIK